MLPLLLLLTAAPPCDLERAATVKWLGELSTQVDRDGPLVSPGLRLVERVGDPLPEFAAAIELEASSTNVSGVAAPDLKKALAENLEQYRMLHDKAPPGFVMLIDRSVPWKRVVAAARVLRESGAVVSLGFADKWMAAAPGPSSIDADLEKVKATASLVQKLLLLAELSPKVYGTCPALAQAMQRPNDEYATKPMLDRLAAALPRCACKVDLPAFRKLTFFTAAPTPLLSAVPLTLSAKGALVRLPGDMPWSAAFDKVLAASAGNKPVLLEE
jgi:hypothetical protein